MVQYRNRLDRVTTRYLTSLTYRDYRNLWIATLSAGAAAWALIVARGWYVYIISDSSLLVGLVTFAAMIPRVIVAPFTGYLSDRFDRRTVLTCMFALNLAHNVVLAILVMLGNAEVWHLVLLSFINGSARAAQMPAGQALIPNLVPKHLLLNAISLGQATMHGSRLVGPAAIAPLLAVAGPESAFLLCSGFYAISLAQTLRIRTASRGRIDPTSNFWGNMIAGLKYAYRTPELKAVIFMALFHCGLTMSFESLLPVLSSQRLHAEEGASFSFLMMAIGAGALISAIAIAGVENETTKGKLFLSLGILSGITPCMLGVSANMYTALLSAAAMGASQAGFMTLTHTMIQTVTPDELRGRVGGVYSLHIGGMMATVNFANGGMADFIAASNLLLVGGVAFAIIVILSLRVPIIKQIYKNGLPPNPTTPS